MNRKQFELEGEPEHGDFYDLNGLPMEHLDTLEGDKTPGLYFNGEYRDWRVLGISYSVTDIMLALEEPGNPNPGTYVAAINSSEIGEIDTSGGGLPELVLPETYREEADYILGKLEDAEDGETLSKI